MKRVEKFAIAFKALAHPHRLTIFLRLAGCCERLGVDREACSTICVGELGKGLGVGQPTVSHHLKELSRAGLISTRKKGQLVECWVAENTLNEFAQFFLKAKQS
jgi:DNA-binding transcriptional ArsR family regulator